MKYLLGEKLNLDWKVGVISVVATLLLLVDYYHPLTRDKYLDRMVLYLVVPLLVTVLIFRENPIIYGFSLGDWKLGLTFTFIAIAVMTPVIYYLARGDAETQKYYAGSLVGLPWTMFMNIFGWEFFFRGWILFGNKVHD